VASINVLKKLLVVRVLTNKSHFPIIYFFMSKKRKSTKDELFFKSLEKIPADQRPWEVLSQAGRLEESQKATRRPFPGGTTEIIWDSRSFEREMLAWFRTSDVPEFLYKR
jgi:hypothetical protein